jgi:signal transduction histidine kinase
MPFLQISVSKYLKRATLPKLFASKKISPILRLQIVGILSTFIFAINCCFEVLFLNRLYTSQIFLIPLLLVLLAVWTIAEISYRSAATETNCAVGVSIPLKNLRLVLILQLAIILFRHYAPFEPNLAYLNSDNKGFNNLFEVSILALTLYFIQFILVSHFLIQAFSSAEKMRSRELNFSRLELQRKLKASLMASSVAHEINQPLSTIILNIQLATNELVHRPLPTVNLGKRLSQIESESKRVVSTIAVMRNLLRNVQTDHRVFDLALVARSALLYQKSFLDSNQISVDLIGLEHECKLFGDSGQLQIAISNLLRNSMEALSCQATNKRHLLLDLSQHRGSICLRVSDNGPGFSESMSLDLILHSTKTDGSGIGLYLVRLAVENHGGSLRFDRSNQLGGAEVTMLLPTKLS